MADREGPSRTSELLLRAGATVKVANRFGATPLSLAATNGNGAIVEKLLAAGDDANAVVSVTGDTAFMIAARVMFGPQPLECAPRYVRQPPVARAEKAVTMNSVRSPN